MSYLDEINGDICYIIEIEINDEKLYLYTKRVALHFADMGKKFLYKRSARRFYYDSEFAKNDYKHRFCRYSNFRNEIID